MGRTIICWLFCVLVHVPVSAAFDEKAFWEALALRNQGEFDKATRAMEAVIEQSSATLEQDERRTLEFEIERIRRIRQDYRLTRERLLEQLQGRVMDFTSEELERYELEGKLDVQVIDGQKLYVNSSASNLILRVPELRHRLKNRRADTMYRRLYNQMLHVQKAQKLTSSSLLLPQDFEVTYTLRVAANAVPAGQKIKAWLPFARSFPHQTEICLLKSEPARHLIAPLEHPHRTVYLERAAKQDHATTFSIHFIYRRWARVHVVDPVRVQPYRTDNPEYAYYLGERKPHIDLGNDELKRVAAEITSGEANPYLAAKRIYNWVAINTIYQYAREYSTIDNISHYTLSRRAGDCGQHGMLFIALCRVNGIPARWTTGWESFNHRGHNMHDWCEFYVEPYGWLPADPDMAVNLLNHADDELSKEQQKELADWLFGNMDHHRLTVNSDFGMPLFPPKEDFRSETVDFQRGEVESNGKNLYFDKWNYSMRIKAIGPEVAESLVRKFAPPAPGNLLPLHGFADGVTTEPVRLPPPADPATTQTPAGEQPTTSPVEAAPTPASTPTPPPAPTPAPDDTATTATPAAVDAATTATDAPKLGPDAAAEKPTTATTTATPSPATVEVDQSTTPTAEGDSPTTKASP